MFAPPVARLVPIALALLVLPLLASCDDERERLEPVELTQPREAPLPPPGDPEPPEASEPSFVRRSRANRAD